MIWPSENASNCWNAPKATRHSVAGNGERDGSKSVRMEQRAISSQAWQREHERSGLKPAETPIIRRPQGHLFWSEKFAASAASSRSKKCQAHLGLGTLPMKERKTFLQYCFCVMGLPINAVARFAALLFRKISGSVGFPKHFGDMLYRWQFAHLNRYAQCIACIAVLGTGCTFVNKDAAFAIKNSSKIGAVNFVHASSIAQPGAFVKTVQRLGEVPDPRGTSHERGGFFPIVKYRK